MSYRAAASRNLEKKSLKNGTEAQGSTTISISETRPAPVVPKNPLESKKDENSNLLNKPTASASNSNSHLSNLNKEKKKESNKGNNPQYSKNHPQIQDFPPKPYPGSSKQKKHDNKSDISKREKLVLSNGRILSESIGKAVTLKLHTGRSILGKVFHCDVSKNAAVLMTSAPLVSSNSQSQPETPNFNKGQLDFRPIPNPKVRVNIVNISNIVKIFVHDPKSIKTNLPDQRVQKTLDFELPQETYLPVEKLKIAHHKVLNEARTQYLRIGENVTPKAQSIFDALSKTLPCRWNKQRIVVLDEIFIDPPYNVENCTSASPDTDTLNRVKKV
ncbi:hypothetical protein BB560_005495, partial [Smittium megazygosporum]